MPIQEILSLQNPLVKHLVKLRESKVYRKEWGRALLSGCKLVKEIALKRPIYTLLVQIGTSIPQGIQADLVCYVTEGILKKVTGLENPEPLAIEVGLPALGEVASVPLLLVLEGISDPGNLGTLLRSSLALGWDGVFITEGSVDPFNEKALRAAKGATFTIPFQYGTRQELQELLKKRGGTILTADAKGNEVSTLCIQRPLVLILGNEAHGPSSIFKNTSELVAIAMHEQMESLNVASAGAILMYQLKRALL